MKMKKIKESKDLNSVLNDYWIVYVENWFFIKPGINLSAIDDLLNSWKKLVNLKLILFVDKKNEDNLIKLSLLKENNYDSYYFNSLFSKNFTLKPLLTLALTHILHDHMQSLICFPSS